MLTQLRRWPLLTFFVLAYGISWGSYWLLSGPGLFPLGAFVAAVLAALLSRGTAGLKDMASRCLRWRVGLRWYAVAILLPIMMAVTAVVCTVLAGAPAPTSAQLGLGYGLLLLLPMAMIDAPLWEEIAWRGFALPHLPVGRAALANTLILGVLLAGWHLPIALSEPALTVPYLLGAIASAVVINWIYYNARSSALLAIIFHSAQNAVGGFYLFRCYEGAQLAQLWWWFAGVYWVVALVLILSYYRTSRRETSEVNVDSQTSPLSL